MKTATKTKFGTMLSPVELEAWIGIPVNTLRNWRHKGIGPTYARLGNHIRYSVSDVETYLESCMV